MPSPKSSTTGGWAPRLSSAAGPGSRRTSSPGRRPRHAARESARPRTPRRRAGTASPSRTCRRPGRTGRTRGPGPVAHREAALEAPLDERRREQRMRHPMGHPASQLEDGTQRQAVRQLGTGEAPQVRQALPPGGHPHLPLRRARARVQPREGEHVHEDALLEPRIGHLLAHEARALPVHLRPQGRVVRGFCMGVQPEAFGQQRRASAQNVR